MVPGFICDECDMPADVVHTEGDYLCNRCMEDRRLSDDEDELQ